MFFRLRVFRSTLMRPALQGGSSARALYAAVLRRGGARSPMRPHPRYSLGAKAPYPHPLSGPLGLDAV